MHALVIYWQSCHVCCYNTVHPACVVGLQVASALGSGNLHKPLGLHYPCFCKYIVSSFRCHSICLCDFWLACWSVEVDSWLQSESRSFFLSSDVVAASRLEALYLFSALDYDKAKETWNLNLLRSKHLALCLRPQYWSQNSSMCFSSS